MLGRVTAAKFGPNITLEAAYAQAGRRLPTYAKLTLGNGQVRESSVGSYDPLGRELVRHEVTETGLQTQGYSYDALGRLSTVSVNGAAQLSYSYDALGNRVQQSDATSNSQISVTASTGDRDRACRVDYGPPVSGPCNVTYDGSGNATSYPIAASSAARMTYYASGLVRSTHSKATSTFEYDGTGEISEINEAGTLDRRFGFVQQRSVAQGRGTTLSLVRHIPGASGIVARRTGATGEWLYTFGEERGTRFSATANGSLVHELTYGPYGTATSQGPTTTTQSTYTVDQWNGGTAIGGAVGMVRLGERLYDPRTGRFMSRDPLVTPRTATRTNPYAFAANDPVNLTDPSGLDFGLCATLSGAACSMPPGGGASGAGAGALSLAMLGIQLVTGESGEGDGGAQAPALLPKTAAYLGGVNQHQQMWPKWKKAPWYDQIKLGTRAVGALKVLGGYASAKVGTALCLTGFGCGLGLSLLANGADLAASGIQELISGDEHPTVVGHFLGPDAQYLQELVVSSASSAGAYHIFKTGVAYTARSSTTVAVSHADAPGLARPSNGRAVFNGLEVRGMRDLSHMSETDLRRMARQGTAGTDHRGRALIQHHHKQNPNGPIIEMPRSNHKIGNVKQHPHGNAKGKGLTPAQRAGFNGWREQYWKARAENELARRGLWQ